MPSVTIRSENRDVNKPVANKKERQKNFHVKVRSGCLTCKQRRVKCDEGSYCKNRKPLCHRCASTGRKCDGYATPKTWLFESDKSKQDQVGTATEEDKHHTRTSQDTEIDDTSCISRWSGPSHLLAGSESQDEFMSVQFFEARTSNILSSFWDHGFWTGLVRRVSGSYPVIRHGLISVGCLALSRRVDPKWSDYQVKLSMLHYSKAMKSLTRIGQVPPVEIVLVACLLFITLEDYRSRREFAHTTNGVKLLAEYETTAKPSRVPDNDISDLFKNHVRPIFDSIRGHCSLFSDVIKPGDSKFRKTTTPSSFTNRSGPRHALHKIFIWLVASYEDSEACKDESLSLGLRNDINEALDTWLTAFLAYHQKAPPDPAREDDAVLFFAHHRLLRMLLSARSPYSELHFDHYQDDFRFIVDSCRTVFYSDSVRTNASLGLIPPLFWAATKCRDPILRREALAILRSSHHTESLWDTCTAANIVERVILIEERGLAHVTSCRDIPHENRVRLLQADHVFQDNDVILHIQHYPYNVNPKNIELDRIPWPKVCDDREGAIPIVTPLTLRYAGCQGLLFLHDGLCICRENIERGPMRNLEVSRPDSSVPEIDPHAKTYNYQSRSLPPISGTNSALAFLDDLGAQSGPSLAKDAISKHPSFAYDAVTTLSSLPFPEQRGGH